MIQLDTSYIANGVLVAVLLAIAGSIYTSTVTMAKLGAMFEAHEKKDDEFHAEVRDELRELRR